MALLLLSLIYITLHYIIYSLFKAVGLFCFIIFALHSNELLALGFCVLIGDVYFVDWADRISI